MDNAKVAFNKLIKKIASLETSGEPNLAQAKPYDEKFKEALDNDLNTSLAITALYDVLKANITDATKLYLIEKFDKVLSLDLIKKANEKDDGADDELAAKVEALIAERAEAKKAKDFQKADKIRADLLDMGIEIKDTREGVVWNKI